MTDHPITPPPELVEQWFLGARAMPVDQWVTDVATQAARCGAVQHPESDPGEIRLTSGKEIIRITPTGFHYGERVIEDAGECHRLLVDFLRRAMPETDWKHAEQLDD